MTEPYPGYDECVARWNVIRDQCCDQGWLDRIEPKTDARDELIEDLQTQVQQLRQMQSENY